MVLVRSYPAGNGDAYLVKASSDPFAMLIDGGYSSTYHNYIKSDLKQLADEGYVLDLVVATHVDADHISGLLTFFRQNGIAQSPNIIPVREVLHNSLRSLVSPTQSRTAIRQDDLLLLQDIRLRGYQQAEEPNSQGLEISARQGCTLAQLLREGGYQWNTHTGETPIGEGGIDCLSLHNVSISILGPNKARLRALKKWWASEMRRIGFIDILHEFDDVFEFLCSFEEVDPGEQMLASSESDLAKAYAPDNSITNGSSISFIAEIEGCRLLFLGDSWADDIVDVLSSNGPSVFDAVKIAHHGSVRNTSLDLLNLVDSPHFFISTNGAGHEHPDYAVLKAIVDRPATFCRTLHFNYSTPASQKLKAYQAESGANFVVRENETDWVKIKKYP